MSVATRIAAPYAKSLLDLARERGAIDAVTRDVEHFLASTANEDLRNLLASPIVSSDRKLKVFDALFGGYDAITRAFLRIVTEKGRESALVEIAAEYMRLYRRERAITPVRVSSAAPLAPEQVERIKSKLVGAGLSTATIELESVVDPSLIGGFVVEVGDRLYDASAKAKLATLRKEFTGNPYVRNIR